MTTEHVVIGVIMAIGASLFVRSLYLDKQEEKKREQRAKRILAIEKEVIGRAQAVVLKITYLELMVKAMTFFVENGDSLFSLSWDSRSRNGCWRYIATEDFNVHTEKGYKHMDIMPCCYEEFTKQCRERLNEVNQCL